MVDELPSQCMMILETIFSPLLGVDYVIFPTRISLEDFILFLGDGASFDSPIKFIHCSVLTVTREAKVSSTAISGLPFRIMLSDILL